jgi:hypothetical protein
MCSVLMQTGSSAAVNRTWGPMQVASPDPRLQTVATRRIDSLLRNPRGLQNGKGNRTKLALSSANAFKWALIDAVGQASVWASYGPLPNRISGRGRPPDNAVFVFIDDIMRACKAAGLKPGLRYVRGSESLPVRVYQELAPLLWPGRVKAPRRVFQRWQRLQQTLIRV